MSFSAEPILRWVILGPALVIKLKAEGGGFAKDAVRLPKDMLGELPCVGKDDIERELSQRALGSQAIQVQCQVLDKGHGIEVIDLDQPVQIMAPYPIHSPDEDEASRTKTGWVMVSKKHVPQLLHHMHHGVRCIIGRLGIESLETVGYDFATESLASASSVTRDTHAFYIRYSPLRGVDARKFVVTKILVYALMELTPATSKKGEKPGEAVEDSAFIKKVKEKLGEAHLSQLEALKQYQAPKTLQMILDHADTWGAPEELLQALLEAFVEMHYGGEIWPVDISKPIEILDCVSREDVRREKGLPEASAAEAVGGAHTKGMMSWFSALAVAPKALSRKSRSMPGHGPESPGAQDSGAAKGGGRGQAPTLEDA